MMRLNSFSFNLVRGHVAVHRKSKNILLIFGGRYKFIAHFSICFAPSDKIWMFDLNDQNKDINGEKLKILN